MGNRKEREKETKREELPILLLRLLFYHIALVKHRIQANIT